MSPDEYDTPAADEPHFPGTVRAAGAVWVMFGGLGLVLASARVGGGGASPAKLFGWMLVALVFVVVGAQTVRGTATDPLGPAVGSIKRQQELIA